MEENGGISLSEAARLASVSASTLKRWLAESGGPRSGARLRKEEVVRCLNRRGLPVPPELESRPRILVADDDADIRETAAWILRGIWPEAVVETAKDGDSAARLLFKSRPDLLVTDLKMPGREGTTLCRLVLESRELSHTKVIAMTGYDAARIRRQFFEAGAGEYLAKPFDAEDLRRSAVRLIGRGPFPPREILPERTVA